MESPFPQEEHPAPAQPRFTGKVALVTGAGSGIGRETALQLSREGATVYCADVNAEGAAQTAGECGLGAEALRLDVTSEADWQSASDRLLRERGRLDLLVHSAGISAGAPLTEMTLPDWRKVLSVNLDGAFLAVRRGLRLMEKEGGSMVLVSSASAIRPAAGAAAYSVSKAGVCMLAQTAAKECRDRRLPIRVNTVCPAGVKTPMWSSMPFFQELVARTGSEDAAYAELAATQGGAFSEPADVVRAILFLASEEARFINGVDLRVDAGFVL